MQKSYVYFLTNKNNSVVYIGVTSNLLKRVYEHKAKIRKGFTHRYNCDKLVYYEEFNDIKQAISREKILKSGNRKRKEDLINVQNPNWDDLSDGWLFYFD
ncbi:GIY-YIG nuclease family protein [Oceanihabitans sp. IOP_32]|uniref:GIY-YIG nuclease family protein n=1 Tax=Oceanihabitans sp. IOP_32 TaxID=2529032 RepID=UPI001292E4DA|nr:GIY-YIG nuclease family protein [Oceanihabitans sp. IOP_32]QFZ54418.1 GIY-YIG nuclease family protein [Oceanihabitans sp. IOP_32]